MRSATDPPPAHVAEVTDGRGFDLVSEAARAAPPVATAPEFAGAGLWRATIRFLTSGVVDPGLTATATRGLDDALASLASAGGGSAPIKVQSHVG